MNNFNPDDSLKTKSSLKSRDGSIKYLFELQDKNTVEAVYIPQVNKYTFCISSQVGCRMGCRFCATGKLDYVRNLEVDEIIAQVFMIEKNTGHRPTSIVFMGQGEPFLNTQNVISAIIKLNEPRFYGFSQKAVTVSTCGIIDQFEILKEKTRASLAVSLHASDNKTRNKIMKINKRYDINELAKAINNFPRTKKEQVMIEYILIKNLNDSDEDIMRMKKLFDREKVLFNLLTFNKIDSSDNLEPCTFDETEIFKKKMIDAGFKTFIRQSRGEDVFGACGQLSNR